MKNILILLITGLSFSLANAQGISHAVISTTILEKFSAGEYKAITAYFDETLMKALPEDKLKAVWESLNVQCGKYMGHADPVNGIVQEYDVTYILCRFEKMNLKMKTVFNSKQQVSGLFFIPENQK